MDAHKKKKIDLSDYSKDAFLTNPVASAQEWTGYVPLIPDQKPAAQNVADMMDVPVSGTNFAVDPKKDRKKSADKKNA